VAAVLRAVLTLAIAFCAVNCRKPAPRPKVDRQELERRFVAGVEAAGGPQVRFEAPPSSRLPETPVEVHLGAQVYPAVLAALESQARAASLQCAVHESRTAPGWRVADLRLLSHGKTVSRWKLCEVRRILHAAIIIDDMGANLALARQFLSLPYPLTLSVLPHLRDSAATAAASRSAGREVMLHLPMQPLASSHASAGHGAIAPGMTSLEIDRILASALASVPGATGVNNHMGSLATADPLLMAAVMKSLAARHLFFIDSRTTAASVAFQEARRQGVPAFYRSVFLDDTASVPYTLEQLHRFRQVLEQQGAALAIGHPYPTTIAALSSFLPEFDRGEVELVPASELLRLPETARTPLPR
jgi:hypothetical protein